MAVVRGMGGVPASGSGKGCAHSPCLGPELNDGARLARPQRQDGPGPDDHACQMGVWAAQRALDNAGIDPEQVDLVIAINDEHKEVPAWTSGIQLAHEGGAARAYACDVGQKCGTGVLGLELTADLLGADAGLPTVLVGGGYRNGNLIDYRDPNVRFPYNLAAGGGAAVLSRIGSGHRMLGSSFLTDGRFSLDVLVPVRGAGAVARRQCGGLSSASARYGGNAYTHGQQVDSQFSPGCAPGGWSLAGPTGRRGLHRHAAYEARCA